MGSVVFVVVRDDDSVTQSYEGTNWQLHCACQRRKTASVVLWSDFLAADPGILGSIPGLPDFLSSSVSGTGSTQPREDK
jgi:hypothetical protein